MANPPPAPPVPPAPEYSTVTIEGKCPPVPECLKLKPKPKPKGKPPILEIVAGVGLFVFLIFSTNLKIKKEKQEAQQDQYINTMKHERPQKTPTYSSPSSDTIDISNFSDLEQQYIHDSCKGQKGVARTQCIKKSINELLDLY